MVVHSPASLCRIVREREGKCRDEEEMEGTSRWEMSDLCGTACALDQHSAAHGMPAHCEVVDGHLTARLFCSALHGCSASFPLALPFLRMIWWGKKTKRGRGGSCVPPERSAQNVCTHTHWMQSGGCSTHAHTHTCSWRASLLPHHSMKKGCGDRHGESVWWCGPLAGMQGVVAMVSCSAAQHGFHLCHATTRMRGNRGREGEGVSV